MIVSKITACIVVMKQNEKTSLRSLRTLWVETKLNKHSSPQIKNIQMKQESWKQSKCTLTKSFQFHQNWIILGRTQDEWWNMKAKEKRKGTTRIIYSKKSIRSLVFGNQNIRTTQVLIIYRIRRAEKWKSERIIIKVRRICDTDLNLAIWMNTERISKHLFTIWIKTQKVKFLNRLSEKVNKLKWSISLSDTPSGEQLTNIPWIFAWALNQKLIADLLADSWQLGQWFKSKLLWDFLQLRMPWFKKLIVIPVNQLSILFPLPFKLFSTCSILLYVVNLFCLVDYLFWKLKHWNSFRFQLFRRCLLELKQECIYGILGIMNWSVDIFTCVDAITIMTFIARPSFNVSELSGQMLDFRLQFLRHEGSPAFFSDYFGRECFKV